MRRALFGEPEATASVIDIHEQDTAPEIVIAEQTTVVTKKNPSKAFTPRLRVTLRVGNEFEGKMHEIVHEADTLSSIVAEQEATKIAEKKSGLWKLFRSVRFKRARHLSINRIPFLRLSRPTSTIE